MAIFKNNDGDFFFGILYSRHEGRYSGNFLRFDASALNNIEKINYLTSRLSKILLAIPLILFFYDRYWHRHLVTQYLYCTELVILAILAVVYFAILPRRLINNKTSLRNENLICMIPTSVAIYRNGGNIFLSILLTSLCSGAVSFGRPTLLFGTLVSISIIFYWCGYQYSLENARTRGRNGKA